MLRYLSLILFVSSIAFAADPKDKGACEVFASPSGTGSGVGGGEITATTFKQIATRVLTQLKTSAREQVLDKQLPVDWLLSEIPGIKVEFTSSGLVLDGRLRDGLNHPEENLISIDRDVWIAASYAEKELLSLHEVFGLKLRGFLDDTGNRYSLEVQRLLVGRPRDPALRVSELEAVGSGIAAAHREIADPSAYHMSSTKRIVFNGPTFTSWEEVSSGYTGGAHGFGGVVYMVFKRGGERILFSDVVNVSAQEMISSIHAKVKAAHEDRYSLGFFRMWANTPDLMTRINFAADATGIMIQFNQYEIGPYSSGPMDIRFTWAELRPLLKPDSVFHEYLQQ